LYETTNKILSKNSEHLKQNTLDVARQNEQSVVDVETLKKVNNELISTLDEILKIRQEGEQKRKQVTSELISIEKQLTDKIMQVKSLKTNDK
jgi:uncharacterized protein YaaN involved in tellurite resistance